ncbi:adhesion G protein-coupled receptor E3-like [Acipenser ruthenus]|uniref:adhesion G protein-coupled receptor E3-like n=1 Tax=Acipenser ruthenus TaxID=7906 RepID=UPI0027424B2E|nr:adhesion G protein-coupled receptor E3-like [Acipenser ruthenus]
MAPTEKAVTTPAPTATLPLSTNATPVPTNATSGEGLTMAPTETAVTTPAPTATLPLSTNATLVPTMATSGEGAPIATTETAATTPAPTSTTAAGPLTTPPTTTPAPTSTTAAGPLTTPPTTTPAPTSTTAAGPLTTPPTTTPAPTSTTAAGPLTTPPTTTPAPTSTTAAGPLTTPPTTTPAPTSTTAAGPLTTPPTTTPAPTSTTAAGPLTTPPTTTPAPTSTTAAGPLTTPPTTTPATTSTTAIHIKANATTQDIECPSCGTDTTWTKTNGRCGCSCRPGFQPTTLAWIEGQTQCTDILSQLGNVKCPDLLHTTHFCLIGNITTELRKKTCTNCSTSDRLAGVAGSLNSLMNVKELWSGLTMEETVKAASFFLNTTESQVKTFLEPANDWKPLTVETQYLAITLKNGSSLKAQETTMEVNLKPLTEEQGFAAAGLVSYIGLELVLDHTFYQRGPEEESGMIQINSRVISALLENTANLESVKFTFKNKDETRKDDRLICVYLKDEKWWSRDGCKTVQFNETYTVCSCTHLSTFAVIMQRETYKEDLLLQLISYIAVGAALLCLALAITTFICTKCIQRASNTIHLHLSISLFLAHLLFLTGALQVEYEVLCAVIAGLLHYLFMASFAWMCLEGVQLFLLVRKLREVGQSKTQALRRRFLLLAGYGLPAVIVAVSAGVFPDGYGDKEICWLKNERDFRWSFHGPIYFIIAVNIFLFIAILWTLKTTLSVLNADVSKLKDTRLLVFKSLAQFLIMGCSWVLGFMVQDQMFRLLFVILNSQQGSFIFIVHCLLNREVRAEYRKWLTILCRRRNTFSITTKSAGCTSKGKTAPESKFKMVETTTCSLRNN